MSNIVPSTCIIQVPIFVYNCKGNDGKPTKWFTLPNLLLIDPWILV